MVQKCTPHERLSQVKGGWSLYGGRLGRIWRTAPTDTNDRAVAHVDGYWYCDKDIS